MRIGSIAYVVLAVLLVHSVNGQNCSQYANLTQCSNDTSCVWDPAPVSACEPLCIGLTTPTSCRADVMCTWNSTACVISCRFLYGNQSACNADSSCTWDPVSNSCKSSAPSNTTASCSTYTTAGQCGADMHCMWDASTQTCATACLELTSEAACESESFCWWDTGSNMCRTLCIFDHHTELSCDLDDHCTWNPVTGICAESCARRPVVGECTSDGLCTWIPSTQACDPACSLSVTAAACTNVPSCDWNPTTQLCQQKCELLSVQDCGSNPLMCVLEANANSNSTQGGEVCSTACVYKFTTQISCDASTYCQWNSAQALCQQSCQGFPTQAACSTTSTCSWNLTSAKCGSSVASIAVTNSQLVAQILDPTQRSVIELALQTDLTAVYAAPVSVIDGRLVVSDNSTTVTVPYTTSIATAVPTIVAKELHQNATWLKSTYTVYRSFGGTAALVVSSYTAPSEPSPPPPPPPPPITTSPLPSPTSQQPSSPSIAMHTILLIAGCSAGTFLAVTTCVLLRWRRNPYAAVQAPLLSAERFAPDEFDRLKAANERVVTYAEAKELKRGSDANPATEMARPRWPILAKIEMPKNTQRADQRGMWDAMCTTLFPAVFEHLTQIRIVMDEQGHIRSDAANAFRILRYHQAIRLHAQGKGNIEFVMCGGARLAMDNADLTGAAPQRFVDFRGIGGDVNAAFERGGFCTHTGTNEPRKIVFGRIRPATDSFVVATLSEATLRDLPTLRGLPPHWTGAMVESAVRLMLRVAGVLLESRRDFSDTVVGVHRGGGGGGADGDDGGAGWRIRCETAEVVSVLATVVSRFWAVDDVLFFCGATGITITPVDATMSDDNDLYRPTPEEIGAHINAPLVG